MAQVELRNITKNYTGGAEAVSDEDKRRPALNRITLTLREGEILSVVGPSGCGKSTLLKVVAGLEHPDQGQIFYNGHDMTHTEPQQRGVGMVFQDYALYPAMRGKGNLHYYFEVHARTEEQMRQRVQEVADLMGVGFDTLLSQKTDTLSGGEQQRVAIARCIVRDPSVFLMDEPICNLDAKLRERTRIEMKKMLRRFRVTTLYVTHDQQEAIFMGDRIAVLRKGCLEQIGTFDELYYTPANLFVATFIGTPPMAVIPAQKIGQQIRIDDQFALTLPSDLAVALPDGDLRLGVRPEGWLPMRSVNEGALAMPVTMLERVPTQQAAFAHGALADSPVSVLLPLDVDATKQVYIQPDWERAYFFAPQGEALLHTPAVPDLF